MYIIDTLSKSLNDGEIERRYEYRVIRSNIKDKNYVEEGIQSYGIEVERKDLEAGKVFKLERNTIKNISPYKYKVETFAKLLYDNLVSPINYVEILEEYISDFDSSTNNITMEVVQR